MSRSTASVPQYGCATTSAVRPCASVTHGTPPTSSTFPPSMKRLYTQGHLRMMRVPSIIGKRHRPALSSTGCHSVSSRPLGSRVSITRPPSHSVTSTQRTRASPPLAVLSRSPTRTASIRERVAEPSAHTRSTCASGAKQPPPRMNSAGSAAGGGGAPRFDSYMPTSDAIGFVAIGTPMAPVESREGSGAGRVAKFISALFDSSSKSASRPSTSRPKCWSAWSRKLERRSKRNIAVRVRR
mmetsp:Transcript_50153/g.115754  ORF Transcript_50153/g.115754 Transcript_50153/m.115754 type:complete len:240 (+) Transcript_50153:840-1559(+)